MIGSEGQTMHATPKRGEWSPRKRVRGLFVRTSRHSLPMPRRERWTLFCWRRRTSRRPTTDLSQLEPLRHYAKRLPFLPASVAFPSQPRRKGSGEEETFDLDANEGRAICWLQQSC